MEFDLHNIRSDDPRTVSEAEAYLGENPDPGVRRRPEAQVRNAIEVGQGLALRQSGRMQGISLIYKYETSSNEPLYSEIGTMRVTANGYSFQAFIASFHLHQIRLEEDSSFPPPVFAVVTPGSASEYVLQHRVGMQPWSPPDALKAVRAAEGVPFSDTKKVLLASPGVFVSARANLRTWFKGGDLFSTPKGSASVHAKLGWFSEGTLDSSV